MYLQLHGEVQDNKPVDGWIREYFPDMAYHGTFVDIGAYEPVNISNSYHFERNGWTVWCIEGNPERIPALRAHRKNVLNYAVVEFEVREVDFHVVTGWGGGSNTAGLSAVELDPKMFELFQSGILDHRVVRTKAATLTQIFENHIRLNEIDILSIDVEGSELKVLRGLDWNRFKAKLIVLENYFAAAEITNFLSQVGYALHRRISYNEFYVRGDLL